MNQEIEIWKDVVGYEALYRISNLGNVVNVVGRKCGGGKCDSKPFLLKRRLFKDGYEAVTLFIDSVPKTHKIHRLVAIAFIPNPEGKLCVNHINSVRNDNRLANLEWCTHGENMKHGFDFGFKTLTGSKNNNSKLTELDVLTIREAAHNGSSIKELSAKFNIGGTTVGGIINGDSWKHIGGPIRRARPGNYKSKIN